MAVRLPEARCGACPCYKVGQSEQGEEVAYCLDQDARWAKLDEQREVEDKAKSAEKEELKEKQKPLYEALKARVMKELAAGNSPFTGELAAEMGAVFVGLVEHAAYEYLELGQWDVTFESSNSGTTTGRVVLLGEEPVQISPSIFSIQD